MTLRLVWFALGGVTGWVATLAVIVWLMDQRRRLIAELEAKLGEQLPQEAERS